VGARIRERRIMMGLSQQQLARMIGVTYQQAHKYERGLNRISAGRLFEIAQVLGVPVSYFFDGLRSDGEPQDISPRQRMCLELARNFSLIDNEKHQEALSQMARALAAQSQAASQRAPVAAPRPEGMPAVVEEERGGTH
jgi:transcriptional regulator with XRE-family HTH domain